MTVIDHHVPRSTADWQPRTERRHEIVTNGGMAGVLRVGAALSTCGYQIHEFVADVRDGVPYASVSCVVAVTATEAVLFVDRLRAVPAVIAVDQR